MKKLVLYVFMMILVGVTFTACGSKQTATKKQTKDNSTSVEENASGAVKQEEDTTNDELLSGKHHVVIKVAEYGEISLELDADVAPISVTNFIHLAKEGFYDGLTFHRIMSGFMIQGGDPNGDGTGGSDQSIKGEFASNDVENTLSHKRGVISMARAQDYDSASSQFFICHADSEFLDGEYAAFGNVTEGMEVVDQICEKVPVEDNNGTVLSENQPKITQISVVD